jgi:hypothetical protein
MATPQASRSMAISLMKAGGPHRFPTALVSGGCSEHVKGRRIPAGDIEALVLDRLRALFASGAE